VQDLPVYTVVLSLPRRITHIGEIPLPRPYPLVEAAFIVGTLAAMLVVSWRLRLPVRPEWAWLYLLLPWAAGQLATRPLADRKPAHIWLAAQLRYLVAEPRLMARLRPLHEPTSLVVNAEVWQL
jgi:hypothetical protein